MCHHFHSQTPGSLASGFLKSCSNWIIWERSTLLVMAFLCSMPHMRSPIFRKQNRGRISRGIFSPSIIPVRMTPQNSRYWAQRFCIWQQTWGRSDCIFLCMNWFLRRLRSSVTRISFRGLGNTTAGKVLRLPGFVKVSCYIFEDPGHVSPHLLRHPHSQPDFSCGTRPWHKFQNTPHL